MYSTAVHLRDSEGYNDFLRSSAIWSLEGGDKNARVKAREGVHKRNQRARRRIGLGE